MQNILPFHKKQKEWEKLLAESEGAGDACFVLAGPDSVSSETFSQEIGRWEMSGQGRKRFFIPAAYLTFTEKNKEGKMAVINLSDFTMNTAMTAMILYEQIYRGYRILNNHPYHK